MHTKLVRALHAGTIPKTTKTRRCGNGVCDASKGYTESCSTCPQVSPPSNAEGDGGVWGGDTCPQVSPSSAAEGGAGFGGGGVKLTALPPASNSSQVQVSQLPPTGTRSARPYCRAGQTPGQCVRVQGEAGGGAGESCAYDVLALVAIPSCQDGPVAALHRCRAWHAPSHSVLPVVPPPRPRPVPCTI